MDNWLETERMILRPITADDTQSLFELDSDPEVMRYINGGYAMPYDAVATQLMPRVLKCIETFYPLGFWAAIAKPTNTFMGWFHFYPAIEHPVMTDLQLVTEHDTALGYRLHKAYWGQGLATEGVQALIHKGTTEWGVTRVVSWALVANRGSTRVMEKAGLQPDQEFWFTEAQLPRVKPEERKAIKYFMEK